MRVRTSNVDSGSLRDPTIPPLPRPLRQSRRKKKSPVDGRPRLSLPENDRQVRRKKKENATKFVSSEVPLTEAHSSWVSPNPNLRSVSEYGEPTMRVLVCTSVENHPRQGGHWIATCSFVGGSIVKSSGISLRNMPVPRK